MTDADTSSQELEILQSSFDRLKSAFSYADVPSVADRKLKLQRLAECIREAESELIDALSEDFGYRVPQETLSSELAVTLSGIAHFRKNLRSLAKRRERTNLFSAVPGRAGLTPRPKGVVGVIAPWNYPFQLAALPAIAALSAGNKVLIKPSEFTPRTGALVKRVFAKVYEVDEVCVVFGADDVGKAFSALPFDHLFFTGSTKVGRSVAKAAAENLVPVTLELGGKSPCLILPEVNLDQAATMLVWGKIFNAGQTCVAPDYVLIEKSQLNDFVAAAKAEGQRQLNSADSGAITKIISADHEARLRSMLEEATASGLKIVPVIDLDREASERVMVPQLIIDPPDTSALMEEEIFGPLLPIVTYSSTDEAIARINAKDHPLALYIFGKSRSAANGVLQKTISGTAARNSTIVHYAAENLPFGGVGASGYGAYHGDAGFYEFSHMQPVLEFPGWTWLARAITPPYGGLIKWITRREIGRS